MTVSESNCFVTPNVLPEVIRPCPLTRDYPSIGPEAWALLPRQRQSPATLCEAMDPANRSTGGYALCKDVFVYVDELQPGRCAIPQN
jgi:hypothetical protein